MRVTFVQPPNGLYDRQELAPPLGLLNLAAVLEQDGVDVTVVDMNLRGMRNPAWLLGDFYSRALSAIATTRPDVVGFTSMALESHICLELARLLKAADPHIVTLLGGPHFGAIAREVLELYPWVDYVVTGEGEAAALSLLHYLRGQALVGQMMNVAYRDGAGVTLRRVLKPLASMHELPFPAYHLVDLDTYFRTNPVRLLDYEHGRGCIFRCSFCYSPVQWGQGEQSKTVDRVVDEVARQYLLGARHLFFVQDNFLNDPAAAKQLCAALAEAHTGMTWNGYGTLPQLTPGMLDLMAASGCTNVFVGVDAVSSTAQQAFAKHCYKGWDKLKERLSAALQRGIGVTCAFMIDMPGADHVETDAALTTALFARALGCGLRLNTLTLYPGTGAALALADQPCVYTDLKPRLMLDTPEVVSDNPYARARPELFPFHNTYVPLPRYERFSFCTNVAHALFIAFPRTLVQYVLTDNGSLWELIERLADAVGDITAIHPPARYHHQWELFLREFPRLSLSRETRSALALERAELSVALGPATLPLAVRVASEVQRYQAGRFTVVDLADPPQVFEQRLRPAEDTGPSRPYLVIRQDGKILHREVSDELASALRRVNIARRGGEPLEVPPRMLESLIADGILHAADSGSGLPASV